MNERQRVLATSVMLALLSACEKGSKPSAQAEGSAKAQVAMPAHSASAGQQDCCMGKNPCKGQGGCAVPESHACAGQNQCKGKGGCNMHCPH